MLVKLLTLTCRSKNDIIVFMDLNKIELTVYDSTAFVICTHLPYDNFPELFGSIITFLTGDNKGARRMVIFNGIVLCSTSIKTYDFLQVNIPFTHRVKEGDRFTLELPQFDTTITSNSYPHTCPNCKGPAYVGFSSVDCMAKCKPLPKQLSR